MLYPLSFFDLQLTFAKKMAQLTQQSYPYNPIWQAYLKGLHDESTDTDWSYQFYLERADQIPAYNRPRWGCFSYEYWSERQVMHLHFANLDGSGYGPLSHQRKEARLADLWSMFMHIKGMHPDVRDVHGSSWLYNLEAYRRLFPIE